MNESLMDIQERLDSLSQDMEARIARFQQGKTCDLGDIQMRIGEISGEIINARPQSACFLPTLKQLVVQLDELALALKPQHDKL